MKTVSIQTTKKVEETVQITLPCWLRDKYCDRYYFITSEGDLIKVSDKIVCLYDSTEPSTPEEIAQAWNRSHSCTEAEFKAVLDKALFRIEEAYTGVTA